MIQYTRHSLDNGLTLVCNTDSSTPFVAVNILYKVGARDEQPHRTGLAHLLEHLMFGGSRNVDDFDARVQQAGGESNAYTNNDYTNYYIILPAANIETALWLESDRMMKPKLTRQSLEIQKNVVVEEFKQHYLNRPYGDLWLQLRPLAYKVHPYRWNTIGIEPEHVERVSLDEVKTFSRAHYAPDNAIIAISGNISSGKALELVKRWFGEIPPANATRKSYPREPRQQETRRLVIANHPVPVPSDMISIAFHAGERASDYFYASDILSDVLANGESARLHANLVKKNPLFSDIDAFLTADVDPGLFIIQGKPAKGIPVKEAEDAIINEIQTLASEGVAERELQKTRNKIDLQIACHEISYQSKATRLAFFEYLGNVDLVNSERDRYEPFSIDSLKETARELFRTGNKSTLLYLSSPET
ncbi:MAG: insulinase family protein [Odoribacteraceae bacterium]|nr:insulinase family protein [Odoribacteraceae bacterium]